MFYAWAEPIYVMILLAQCAFAWALGLLIEKHRGRKAAKVIMIASIVISLSALLVFKYTDFILQSLGRIASTNIGLLGLALPIGISFYTFQILSYTIDLYKGKIQVNRNFLDFSTYVTMFPQLVAGPIVRYTNVERELSKRRHSAEDIAIGLRRFIIGLGKKVLIANVMGELVDLYKLSSESSLLFAWLYVAAYALQIYFDFSGYSDMAIGLGRVLGFRFLENFNYPYIAKSITEFWRRWHISLSSWFKDYVYIPMGGSRASAMRHVANIIVVWMLTGFWHGANWNFIAWGLYFAAILLAEKLLLKNILEKMPGIIRHAYVMVLVLISWVFFDNQSLAQIGETVSRLFGVGTDNIAGMESTYYLRSYLVPMIIGIVGCTPIPKALAAKLKETKSIVILEPLALGVLLIVTTAYLVDGSFNPFIYFRF